MLVVLPQSFLRSFFPLPRSFRDVGQATLDFKNYMQELLVNERQLIFKHEPGAGNLISALVRASDNAKDLKEQGKSAQSLSDDEIYGNIFIYNLAGHETTANALFCAIALLAVYPEWQKWVSEEIDLVLEDTGGIEPWDYETVFPRLKRCLAVMFETLRLYNSVVFIPKTTGFHAQTFSLHEKSHTLPANTSVTINIQALHTDPSTWGPDALTWCPGRWLDSKSAWLKPAKGTFIPWADGPRVCPGRKFAQVEFVAAMAGLFRHHRVRPALLAGEDPGRGRKRLRDMVEDSALSALTLQVRRPREVALVWSKV